LGKKYTNEGVSIVTGIILLFNINTTKNTKIEIPVTNLNNNLSEIFRLVFPDIPFFAQK
jgi:dimeric dUTPase (all-alpha-NTP-PPase superfamily)